MQHQCWDSSSVKVCNVPTGVPGPPAVTWSSPIQPHGCRIQLGQRLVFRLPTCVCYPCIGRGQRWATVWERTHINESAGSPCVLHVCPFPQSDVVHGSRSGCLNLQIARGIPRRESPSERTEAVMEVGRSQGRPPSPPPALPPTCQHWPPPDLSPGMTDTRPRKKSNEVWGALISGWTMRTKAPTCTPKRYELWWKFTLLYVHNSYIVLCWELWL